MNAKEPWEYATDDQDLLVNAGEYSEQMRKIGRGLMLSSQYSEDYADNIIRAALAAAKETP